jgi:dihydrofolate reductase
MGRVIVIEFVSLDGFTSDPDGSAGTPYGGWAFRHGPEAVSGDKFLLGSIMDDGVMLLGRRTWELFTKIWPGRTDDFSVRMNKMAKLVASNSLTDASAWSNSTLLDGDLVEAVRAESRDVVVTGSLKVVRALQEQDLVDEYRLLTFPSIVGGGERLFPAVETPIHLTCVSATQVGAAVLAKYERSAENG